MYGVSKISPKLLIVWYIFEAMYIQIICSFTAQILKQGKKEDSAWAKNKKQIITCVIFSRRVINDISYPSDPLFPD